jgi:putative glutamine amidotransferase
VGARLTRAPLIGITTSELRRPDSAPPIPYAEPPGTELALGLSYPAAVLRAGATPVILAPLPDSQADPILERLDGLLLSGGPDIDPSAYGQEPHPLLGPTEPRLDVWELALTARALEIGLPVLGVCRGLQVLDVATGGTLHQHLPDVVGDAIGHRQSAPGSEPTHRVDVEPGTRLAELLGAEAADVNSFHHQGIDRLGEGLRVTARAPDGVIEAIEGTGPSFVLGVQWHLESLVDGRPRQLAILTALIDAAATARDRAARMAA